MSRAERGPMVLGGRIDINADPPELSGVTVRCTCDQPAVLMPVHSNRLSGTIACLGCGNQLWPLDLAGFSDSQGIEIEAGRPGWREGRVRDILEERDHG